MAGPPGLLANSSSMDKVTVDRAYFDAMVRRADCHAPGHNATHLDSANVLITRAEYHRLARIEREYRAIKTALLQGGLSEQTIQLLVDGADANGHRKDSATPDTPHGDTVGYRHDSNMDDIRNSNSPESLWRSNGNQALFNKAPGGFHRPNDQSNLHVPSVQRQASYGMSMPDDPSPEDEDGLLGEDVRDFSGSQPGQPQRTLYFCGLPERTTYRDLVSVVKGSKILSINVRNNSATVSFLDGAAEFLAWAKRNDIYLHTKRIEVRWADRQFRLNKHVGDKIRGGATRNLVIRDAADKGLTEDQVREDMEHIHNLIIIDVTFHDKDAYVSTNCCHNALYARTCMMSRSAYKGCKIEFFPDECDVPLPQRTFTPRPTTAGAKSKRSQKMPINNRFGLLNIDGTEANSNEENRTPSEEDSQDTQTIDYDSNYGVRLDFLDS